MEGMFPVGFASGDMRGHKTKELRLSNRVYNRLKSFADKDEKQRARLHEKVRWLKGHVTLGLCQSHSHWPRAMTLSSCDLLFLSSAFFLALAGPRLIRLS